VAKHKTAWRELTKAEKIKYAVGMRRLNLGIWGYPVSTLRAIHLTTREGNDNTTKVFARDLRKLVLKFRGQGYDLQYDGTLEYSPGKHLLHFHGLLRVKGGFLKLYAGEVRDDFNRWVDVEGVVHSEHIDANRRALGDKWNEIHNAFVVQITPVDTKKQLKEYILKHMMKQYIGEDEDIRNKFLFSKGWMRKGWKEVEGLAKLWTLGGLESDGGLSAIYMDKVRWDKVNEIMQAWAEKKKLTFYGDILNGKLTGYLFMELGRIREVFGSAFVIMFDGKARRSTYEYLDY